MDPNLMSCPTCAHSVSNNAEVCAYCGGILVIKEQQSQTDDTEPGENAQVAESPPPLTQVAGSPPLLSQEEIPPTDKISDDAGETHLEATGQSDFSVLQPQTDSPAAAETSEPAAVLETVSASEPVSLEEEIESKHPDDEPELESKPENEKQIQNVEGESEIAQTEAARTGSVPGADAEPAAEVKQDFQEPEGETAPAVDNVLSIAQNKVQTETVTDEIQSSPELEAAELSDDEAVKSEIWAKNIVELIDNEASQHESGAPPTLDNPQPMQNIVEEIENMPLGESQPKSEADIKTGAQADSLSEPSGGTIVLDLNDIVESPAGVLSYKTEETAISESHAKALKIENDALELAAAIEKQKEALTKAQSLKKQKEAPDPAQAVKTQTEAPDPAQAVKTQTEAPDPAQAVKTQTEAPDPTQAVKTQTEAPDPAQAVKTQTEAPDPAQAVKTQTEAPDPAQAVKKQTDALDQAQALKKQKEALDQAQALKKQKAALAKAQALKEQKEARAKAQALKMQKLVQANAEALKRKKAVQAKAQALTQQKAAQAAIEAAKKGDSAAVRTVTAAEKPGIDRSLQANTAMQTLIEKFKGQVIGINYDNSAEFREAQLVEANADYFSVFVKDKGLHFSYPLNTILTVVEGKNGVDVGNKKQPNKFSAVIKVYPLVLF